MNKPKIALVGYGNMGREIEKIAIAEGLSISEIFDIDRPLTIGDFDFDIAIDFSIPSLAVSNVKTLAEMGKKIVLGTTGWYKHLHEIRRIIDGSRASLVWGSNFSTGMHMYFRIAKAAARLVNHCDEYDIMLHEMHHGGKLDSPSGTANSIAEIIMQEVGRKTNAETKAVNRLIEPETLHVSSTRGGNIPGTHTIYIDSPADTLELTHRARNRKGFARGAVTAALWLYNNTGFYEYSEVLDSIWNKK